MGIRKFVNGDYIRRRDGNWVQFTEMVRLLTNFHELVIGKILRMPKRSGSACNYPQNAGNGISETLELKIFPGSMTGHT